jgi:hypothetical protein
LEPHDWEDKCRLTMVRKTEEMKEEYVVPVAQNVFEVMR